MSKESLSNSRIDPQSRRVTASIFDRLLLIDDRQQRQLDDYDAKALRRDVRQNLEHLLNTRRPTGVLASELSALSKSTFYFGVPDFTEIGFGGTEQIRAICEQVEAAIAQFETRLMAVRVELNDLPEHGRDRVLRFRIRAKLQARPRPQDVIYDSIVDPATHSFEVRTT